MTCHNSTSDELKCRIHATKTTTTTSTAPLSSSTPLSSPTKSLKFKIRKPVLTTAVDTKKGSTVYRNSCRPISPSPQHMEPIDALILTDDDDICVRRDDMFVEESTSEEQQEQQDSVHSLLHLYDTIMRVDDNDNQSDYYFGLWSINNNNSTQETSSKLNEGIGRSGEMEIRRTHLSVNRLKTILRAQKLHSNQLFKKQVALRDRHIRKHHPRLANQKNNITS